MSAGWGALLLFLFIFVGLPVLALLGSLFDTAVISRLDDWVRRKTGTGDDQG